MEHNNDLIRYCFNGNFITTITDMDGNPWWVASHVCNVLGIGNSRKAVSVLDDDEKASVTISDTSSSSRKTVPVTIVNEPGLYSLILRSRKPEAKEFKRWIIHDVLPSIRKSGRYLFSRADRYAGGKSFKNMMQVLAYVQSEGLQIKKSKIYNDVKKGLISRKPDGSISFSAVQEYIKLHFDTGKPQYVSGNFESPYKYTVIARQHREIKIIFDTARKMARSLGHTLQDARIIAQLKVEEATGIKLADFYSLHKTKSSPEKSESHHNELFLEEFIDDFVDECCVLGDEFKSSLSVLYGGLVQWLLSIDPIAAPPSMIRFGEFLSQIFDRTHHAGMVFHGVALLPDWRE